MDPKNILLATLVAILIAYHVYWYLAASRRRAAQGTSAPPTQPTMLALGIAFVANFFDTLGIGSYATTTTMARAWHVLPDEKLPGTLNVGYVLPTVVQALIYITIVEVEFPTLVIIIGAAVIGAWLGAGVVASLPRRGVQIGMGTALFGAAGLMLVSLLGIGPAPGVALGLAGAKLAIAFVISMILGSLMMLGIGYYAPCLIMISLLGMNPTAAFPIMMGACAFLMPAGSLQFIRKDSYDLRTALAFTFGGPGAVLIAAFIVKSLPLDAVRWLVIAVVIYTATAMMRTAAIERAAAQKAMQAPASA